MAFTLTDEHIEQHARDGFTVFREILPPSLLHDLRVGAERGREICLQYCKSMPGAVQAVLHAGDFMLYRNCLWHIGNYSPHRKRATLHEIVATEEWLAWIATENAAGERRKQAGVSWMNPYEPPPAP